MTAAERRADELAVTALLNCFLREAQPDTELCDRRMRVRLRHLGAALLVGVRHHSATGHHLFDLPVEVTEDGCAAAAVPGPAELAGLLGRELAAGDPRADPRGLVEAVEESRDAVARFLAAAAGGAPARPLTPFLRAEQSLLGGHPLHPTPKTRTPMTPGEIDEYSPELGAAFALHWFGADRSLVVEDSALPTTATALLAGLLVDDDRAAPELRRLAAAGAALLPVHPWQAARLRERADVRALLDAGRLVDHGRQGAPWSPTSSVRTAGRPGTPWMLKLSLGVRITNSVRLNLRKELARGVEVHRLLEAGLGDELAARFPGFGILRDPAWATLAPPGDGAESGFEVVLRENPFGEADEASVVAALCEPAPDGGAPPLAHHVHSVATARACTVEAAAHAWFARYLEVVVDPILWLHGAEGIALEAHQQNGVVLLRDGLPAGFRYRDNQGYYFRRSRAGRLRGLVPDLNAQSDTVCDDAVAEERLGYYLGINHLLGLIGAMGRAGLAAEPDLLAGLARHLAAPDRAFPSSPVVERLLVGPTLRCKANLRTRLDDMDELVGPMESQSVYVEIPNPLRAAVAAGAGA